MLKRVDVGVYDMIKSVDDGKPLTELRRPTTSKVDGVGYATSGGFVDDIKTELDDYASEDHRRRDQGADGPAH